MKEHKIKAIFTFEMLGRPPEHLKTTLSEFIDKLETIPSVHIENKTIHEPKLVEDEKVKDVFTTFAEVEVSADNFNALSLIVFNALPAHVEIIEPDSLNLSNNDLSNMLTDLTVRIHKYDEIAKKITFERSIMIKKLAEADKKIKELGGESILKKPEEKVEEKVEENSEAKEEKRTGDAVVKSKKSKKKE